MSNNILNRTKNITIRELFFHYNSLSGLVGSIFFRKNKTISGNTIIPFNREEISGFVHILRNMWKKKYGKNFFARITNNSDSGIDAIDIFGKGVSGDDFPWDDYKSITGVDDLRKFIQYFVDNFDKLASDNK